MPSVGLEPAHAGTPTCPTRSVLVAGTSPERYLGRLTDGAFDHVVLLDAVGFGGAPGSVAWLEATEIAERFPQVSTHRISLGTLARLIESRGRTKVWLLGVQPESLRPGTTLTRTVQRTLEMLVALCQPTPSEVAR